MGFLGAMIELWDEVINYLSSSERWLIWLGALIKIIVIVIASRLVIRISTRIIDHSLKLRRRLYYNKSSKNNGRSDTMAKLLKNTISYTINFIVIVLVIDTLGYNVLPLLAGAGVLGLAIGFGAQNLVRDVITGFFIIFEGQFSVGDVIQIRTYKGTVEEIGLRVTKMKSWSGELFIIPNGTITEVINFSRDHSLSTIDVTIENRHDFDQLLQTISDVMGTYSEQIPEIMEKPQVLGLQSISKSEVVVRIETRCQPNEQLKVTRALNKQLKQTMLELGIEKAV